ncbi:MAG: hypothetical protein JNM72_05605 [Deltaproteobacteria bacterium]|nr:hypothetical protein [Deltaproteobacteria bacterium]
MPTAPDELPARAAHAGAPRPTPPAPMPPAPWLLAPPLGRLLLAQGVGLMGLAGASFGAVAVLAARLPPSQSGLLVPAPAQLLVLVALYLLPGWAALLVQPPGGAPAPLRLRLGVQLLLLAAGGLAGAARPVWLPAGQVVGPREVALAAGLPAALLLAGLGAALWASWSGRLPANRPAARPT